MGILCDVKKLFILFICILFCGCSHSSPDEAAPLPTLLDSPDFCVALDFGHGGFDGGAVGVDTGVVEAELNYCIGMLVMNKLNEQNVQVLLTRTDETAIGDTKNEDMHRRGEILCSEGVDIVVSIHMNKFQNRSVNGPMVYYQAGAEAGEELAQTLMDALTAALGRKDRLASAGNNFVTRIPSAPAALVECGFLSNHDEELLLQDAAYQEQLAEAITQGIMEYLNKSE